jgi:hypothetical protein
VRITLVRDIKDEAIFARVEYPVKGYRELDDTEVRSNVTAICCRHIDDFVAEFLRKEGELALFKSLNVRGPIDRFQDMR